MIYITIDAGTTNTRAKVWQKGTVVSEASVEAGVRDTAITGSKSTLQQGVKKAVEHACQSAGIRQEDVALMIASGMITSELGLHEVPHLSAPAGIEELAAGMTNVLIPVVSQLPIWFIPGVKNNVAEVTLDNCEQMDMMRGEETEAIGALCQLKLAGNSICILPGSHTKFVEIDQDQKIRGCLTTMAGELLGVITQNTILSGALNHSFAVQIDEEMLLKGAYYAQSVGLGRACFSLRILDRFTKRSTEEKRNFLLGALLGTDLTALKHSKALAVHPDTPVVVLGKKLFKEAFAALIQNDPFFQGPIHTMTDAAVADLAGYGAIAIAKRRGIVC